MTTRSLTLATLCIALSLGGCATQNQHTRQPAERRDPDGARARPLRPRLPHRDGDGPVQRLHPARAPGARVGGLNAPSTRWASRGQQADDVRRAVSGGHEHVLRGQSRRDASRSRSARELSRRRAASSRAVDLARGASGHEVDDAHAASVESRGLRANGPRARVCGTLPPSSPPLLSGMPARRGGDPRYVAGPLPRPRRGLRPGLPRRRGELHRRDGLWSGAPDLPRRRAAAVKKCVTRFTTQAKKRAQCIDKAQLRRSSAATGRAGAGARTSSPARPNTGSAPCPAARTSRRPARASAWRRPCRPRTRRSRPATRGRRRQDRVHRQGSRMRADLPRRAHHLRHAAGGRDRRGRGVVRGDRRAAVATCQATNPPGAGRDACIQTADSDAFVCRDDAREAQAPGLAQCTKTYVGCVRAARPREENHDATKLRWLAGLASRPRCARRRSPRRRLPSPPQHGRLRRAARPISPSRRRTPSPT